MARDPKILEIGPVLLTIPDGCSAEVAFTFTAPDEKLVLSSYAEPADAEPRELAQRRMGAARAVGAGRMEVLREKAGKVGEHPSFEIIIKAQESDGKIFTICLALIKLSPKRFLDVTYQFGDRKNPGFEDFDQMIASLRFDIDEAPREKPAAPPPGWILREDIPTLRLQMRTRLKRTTPCTFADMRRQIRWSAEAWVLGLKPEGGLDTIPPEVSSPMRAAREDSYSHNDVAGSVSTIRAVDPETGRAGERVVRAEMVLKQKFRVVIRGAGPDSSAEKLDADLKFIFKNLKPKD